MLLSHDEILRLHAAAISARLLSSRDVLFSTISPLFVASLPMSATPGDQVLRDLDQLAAVGRLADGSVPLLIWLSNATYLTQARKESAVFREALRKLEDALGAERSTPATPRPLEARGDARGAVVTKRASGDGARDMDGAWREGAVKVFLSADPADARFLDTLERHLASLARTGAVDLWSDSRLLAGEDRRARTQERLETADVVVLIVSADFLANDRTREETDLALALRDRKGTRVVLVRARPALLPGPLAEMQALPRSSVSISSSSDADAVYVEIARELSAIVADLRERATTGARAPAPVPIEGSPDVRVGLSIDEIFVRGGVPEHTYVVPEQAAEIGRCLARLGRGLVLEGPTQIGKTTVVTKLFDPLVGARRYTRVDLYREGSEAQILTILSTGTLQGHLLVDNAQFLPDGTLARVARFMRVLADERPATGKVTLIGISNVASRLARLQPDIVGRFDRVELNRQPPARVRELVMLGQRVANVHFDHAEEIVAAARGSFRLAQELCYQCAVAAGVEKVTDDAPRPVDTLPDDGRVRAAARDALDDAFGDLVARFVVADRGSERPGACIALLWLLSLGADGRVVIKTAAERYATLDVAFRWIQEEDRLAAWLQAPENVAVGALAYSAGEIRAPDPRFLYYLGLLDWKHIGSLAGVDVLLPSESLGDLQIVHRVYAGGGAADPASIVKGSLLDAPRPFPWWHPSARTLLALLGGAYPDVDTAFFVAQHVAGFNTNHVNRAQGIEPVWRALLESAASQRKLQDLMKVVLADDTVKAYHGDIRNALAPPGAPSGSVS